MDVFDAENCSWSPFLDFPRGVTLVWGGSACIGQKLYLVGGLVSKEPDPKVHCYSFQTRSWAECSPMPSGVLGVVSTELNGKIYSVCQAHISKEGADVYDAESDRWISIPPPSHSRGRHGIVSMQEKNLVLIFGGIDKNGRSADVIEQYDPRQGQWMGVGQMPRPGLTVFGAARGDSVYIMGGTRGAKGDCVRTVDVYDTRQQRWTTGPDLNYGRTHSAAVFLENDLYVVGGVDGEKTNCKMERLRRGRWETNLVQGNTDLRSFHTVIKIPTHLVR